MPHAQLEMEQCWTQSNIKYGGRSHVGGVLYLAGCMVSGIAIFGSLCIID